MVFLGAVLASGAFLAPAAGAQEETILLAQVRDEIVIAQASPNAGPAPADPLTPVDADLALGAITERFSLQVGGSHESML